MLNFATRNRKHSAELERLHKFKIESGMLKKIKNYLKNLHGILKQRGIANNKAEMEIINQKF